VTSDGTGIGGALTLAAEFPPVTREQWQGLVAKVLPTAQSGAPERELETVTADGIAIAPLYIRRGAPAAAGFPGQAPFVRGRRAAGQRDGWDIRQRHAHPEPAVAREQILEDLEGGVSSVWLGLGPGQIPVDGIPEVLADVYLDLAAVVLDAGEWFVEAARSYLDVAARRDVAPGSLLACLGADPLGVLARTGVDSPLEPAINLAANCAARLPGVRAIVVDALPYHEAGGTDTQELGCALAAGVSYLRALRAAGLPAETAFEQLEFRYAATADQFTTIAKLRAARRVWSRVAQLCGLRSAAAGQRQHAVGSWTMQTRRDPWNNILRGTLACFAAGVGGADAVTVVPLDAAIGLPDALARRVARNVHALLVEESNVARVIDPAGGSWYVEALTEELAHQAWEQFRHIERAGGLRVALRSGFVADQLAVSRQARRDALAHRRYPVTGVSEFPLVGETVLDRISVGAAPRPPGGLPRIRWAQWHEEFRDRSDAFARATGAVPTVTLVLLDGRQHGAAGAEQVTALLAPAGIATRTAGLDGVSSGTAPPVACVCGADEADPDQWRTAVRRLRAMGARRVFVASDVDSGADGSITAGTDILALYRDVLDALEVPR